MERDEKKTKENIIKMEEGKKSLEEEHRELKSDRDVFKDEIERIRV